MLTNELLALDHQLRRPWLPAMKTPGREGEAKSASSLPTPPGSAGNSSVSLTASARLAFEAIRDKKDGRPSRSSWIAFHLEPGDFAPLKGALQGESLWEYVEDKIRSILLLASLPTYF